MSRLGEGKGIVPGGSHTQEASRDLSSSEGQHVQRQNIRKWACRAVWPVATMLSRQALLL